MAELLDPEERHELVPSPRLRQILDEAESANEMRRARDHERQGGVPKRSNMGDLLDTIRAYELVHPSGRWPVITLADVYRDGVSSRKQNRQTQ